MDQDQRFEHMRAYFENTLKNHGTTPRGVDWNGEDAHRVRFEQISKIIQPGEPFSLLDYGSGYGAYASYLVEQGYELERYIGYDLVPAMVAAGRAAHPNSQRFQFTTHLADVPVVDYASACGVFNLKLDASDGEWTHYVLDCLGEMNDRASKGFSANFLTRYSDADRMRPDLYYADPGFLFDYCKIHFSRNVALLHDYNLYDFTLLVRKL